MRHRIGWHPIFPWGAIIDVIPHQSVAITAWRANARAHDAIARDPLLRKLNSAYDDNGKSYHTAAHTDVLRDAFLERNLLDTFYAWWNVGSSLYCGSMAAEVGGGAIIGRITQILESNVWVRTDMATPAFQLAYHIMLTLNAKALYEVKSGQAGHNLAMLADFPDKTRKS